MRRASQNLRLPTAPGTPDTLKRIGTATTTGSHGTLAEVRRALSGKRVQAHQAELLRFQAPPLPLPPKIIAREQGFASVGSIPLLMDVGQSSLQYIVPKGQVHSPKIQEDRPQFVVKKAAPLAKEPALQIPSSLPSLHAPGVISHPIMVNKAEPVLFPDVPPRSPPQPPLPPLPPKPYSTDTVGRWSIVSDEAALELLVQSRKALAQLDAASDSAASLNSSLHRARCEAVLSHYRPLSSVYSSSHASSIVSNVSSPQEISATDSDTLADTPDRDFDFGEFYGQEVGDREDGRESYYEYQFEEGLTTANEVDVRLTRISEAPSILTNETGKPWYRWH
ncbi:hypothetical protein BCR37DRAFT_379924 [Protomyces lactucae-debilis]|uniref:Uncharacterized protein n=1 Tax=Protomyces lactucae-debilis TaxID=2754530 RepID=A0A1Y2FFD6_PROLT|nr:uncharacterized protein BCR37DRAFT_379924 [Protomyces lactucae-debilis]ORY82006.1 hypothetical protein BCR37DRAFT_379924 [Protomyces lactucae-debilis]